MGSLVADSVGRAYSGKLVRGQQPRWGPPRSSVPQVQEEAGEGEQEEEKVESNGDQQQSNSHQ